MKTSTGTIALCLSGLLTLRAVNAQTQQPLPIAPQPVDMPAAAPNAPFSVTVVSYQFVANGGYSFRFVGAGGGKALGNIESGTGIRQATYDPATQTVFPITPAGTIYGFDGVSYAGTVNGSRCFVTTPAGTTIDPTPSIVTPTPVGTGFYANYYSECVAVDNGVPVGTQGDGIFTTTLLTGGESFSTLTGQGQTAYIAAPSAAFGSCCSRARAIKGDEVVGDVSTDFGTSAPVADPLDPSPAKNPNSAAVLWKGIPGNNVPAINLAGIPSIATATNGSQEGGWAGSHAVMWSGSAASMVDLNPPGYFDSRVTGMAATFQVGDGWLGGPANTLGAVRHALMWRGSAASVVDLNQYLPASISGAAIDGVDIDGNIFGRLFYTSGTSTQELGLYFRANPAMSLASLTLSSASPAPGTTVTGTVTLLAPAAPGGVFVTLSSSNGGLVQVPLTVLIPEGQTSTSFNITSSATFFLAGPAPVTLTAQTQINARSVAMNVTPAAAPDPLVSVTLPAMVAPGGTVAIQVNLATPAPTAGVLVNFATSSPSVVPVPASVLIPAGQISATVSVTTNSAPLFQPVQVTVQAQTGTSIQHATFTVATVPTPAEVSLGAGLNQVSSVQGNTSGSGFVLLSAAVPGPVVVTLSNTNPALTVPSSVSFPAGAWQAGFNYTASPVGSPNTGTLTATLNGVSTSIVSTVTTSPAPAIQSLRIPLVSNTQTWSAGETLTGTIVLSSPAFLGGMTVALATDTPSAVQIPASVAFPSLGTTATFPVTALQVAGATTVAITATVPGLAGVSVTLTVIPGPALAIASCTLTPYSMIGPGVVTTGTVTINQPAPAGGVTLSLGGGNTTAARFPATVAIAAGQTSAAFNIQGNSVSAPTAVTLTASYTGPLAPLGAGLSTPLTVAPTDTLKAPKPTWSTSTHLLSVTATSTNVQAIITVLNANGNVPLGTMTNLGNGNYSFQTTIASITGVNFKSNFGGSTGQGVTIVP